MPQFINTANAAGALGAALSGGGSAIIAFADKDFNKIAEAMKKFGEKHTITGQTKILNIINDGALCKLF